MKYASLLLLTVLLFLSSPVAQEHVNTGSGNTLLPMCKAAVGSGDNDYYLDGRQGVNVGYCFGLVNGVAFASPRVCPSKSVTTLQETRVVVKYLEDNPQTLNLGEATLTERALSKAFPCTK